MSDDDHDDDRDDKLRHLREVRAELERLCADIAAAELDEAEADTAPKLH